MQLYAKMLNESLKPNYNKTVLLKPKPIINKINFKYQILKKWFGYIDNYLLFGLKLLFIVNKKDIVHICDHANSLLFPFIRSKKIIITCHDVINLKYIDKNKLSYTGNIYQKAIIFFLKKFNTIICVSKHTQIKLLKLFKIKKEKTFLIYNSINQSFKDRSIKYNDRYNFKYFIHVGDNKENKNKANLIQIFGNIKKFKKFKNHKLLLVGSKNNKKISELIIKKKLHKDILNLVNPNTSKLSKLYKYAEALIFPSLEEGFGWPIIEAQLLGCLVIIYNKPPMNEISNNACIYIDENDNYKSAKIINNKILKKKKIIKLGYENVKRFEKKIFYENINNLYKFVENN